MACALLLAACSSDKATGPDGLPPEGGPYDGTWVLSWGSVTGDAASCRLPSFTLALHQYGDSVAGTYSSHGDLACLRGGVLYGATPGSGRTGGHLSGDTLQFSFSLSLFETHATAHDSTLTGVLVWRVAFSSTQTTYSLLTSTWIARRIPGLSTPDSAADIELYPGLLALIGGDSGQLADTVRNADGQILPGTAVTFATSDPGTATVSTGGMLRTSGGTVKVFSVSARTGRAYVDAVGVNFPGAARLSVVPGSLAISRYHEAQLTVQVLDSAGGRLDYVTPTFYAAPGGLVSVSSTGMVTAADSVGTTNVIVRAGAATASVPVSVVAIPMGLEVSPAIGRTVIPHDSVQLVAQIVDSEGLPVPGAIPSFASSDSAVMAVSSTGLVRSVGPVGSADITVRRDPFHTTLHFTVWSGYLPSVVATTRLGGQPFGAAISRSGAYYVGDGSGGGLYRGDLPGHGLSHGPSISGWLRSIAFDSAGRRAFIAPYGSRFVDIVDADSGRLVDSIDVSQAVGPGQGVVSVALSPDGVKLLVGAGTFIVSYDAQSLTELDSASVGGSSVAHFSFHPTLARGYASVVGSVEEFDLSTLHLLRVWPLPNAQATLVSPDGTELYVAAADTDLRVINLSSGQLEAPIEVPGLYDLKLLAGPNLIVAGGLNGDIFVIDPVSRKWIERLPVGGAPRRMALDPSGQVIIEANESGWVDFIQ